MHDRKSSLATVRTENGSAVPHKVLLDVGAGLGQPGRDGHSPAAPGPTQKPPPAATPRSFEASLPVKSWSERGTRCTQTRQRPPVSTGGTLSSSLTRGIYRLNTDNSRAFSAAGGTWQLYEAPTLLDRGGPLQQLGPVAVFKAQEGDARVKVPVRPAHAHKRSRAESGATAHASQSLLSEAGP